MLPGSCSIIDSIWAFSYNGTLVDKLHGALLGHSLTTYAVIWLIVGITSVVTGYMVTRPGSLSAEISRRAGMAVAGFNALLAMTWMPYYPVWALLYIAIGIIVIYALVVYFDEEVTTD